MYVCEHLSQTVWVGGQHYNSISQLGRFSTPLTGQNCKSLVRGIGTKFSITNLLLGHRVLGQH